MYFHGARFSNYEAWLSDPTHIKPSAQVVWPIVGQEILNGDVGGGFQGIQITSGFFQLWRASGITSELQLYTTAIGGLVMAAAMFFAGWFHYHKAAPKLEWFQNVESMLNHHLGGLLGLGSLGWAGHQIHVSLPVNKLLDAGVDPKEIPLPHDLLLNRAIMADLYPSFAKGIAPFFTLNWSEYSDFLTFKGGLNPVTGGLWLSDTAHHHVAIAVLFLVAGHMYRTNWGIGHSMKEILEAHKGPFTGEGHVGLYEILTTSWHAQLAINLALFGSLSIIVAYICWVTLNSAICWNNLQQVLSLVFLTYTHDPRVLLSPSIGTNSQEKSISRKPYVGTQTHVCLKTVFGGGNSGKVVFSGINNLLNLLLWVYNIVFSTSPRHQSLGKVCLKLVLLFNFKEPELSLNPNFVRPALGLSAAHACQTKTMFLFLPEVKTEGQKQKHCFCRAAFWRGSLSYSAGLKVLGLMLLIAPTARYKSLGSSLDCLTAQVFDLNNKGSSETTRGAFLTYALKNLNPSGNSKKSNSYFRFENFINISPEHKNAKNINNSFLEWFIGFVEGDGSFGINNGRPYFIINQADLGLVKKIRTELGFGIVKTFNQNQCVYASFAVYNKEALTYLIYLFNGNLHLWKTHKRFCDWVTRYNLLFSETITVQPRLDPSLISLKTGWLAGFFDAEGCCYAHVRSDPQYTNKARLDLKATFDQKGELDVVKQISTLFAVSNVTIRNFRKQYYRVEITSKNSLKLFIKYLDDHKLQGRKSQTYAVWRKLVNLFLNQLHLKQTFDSLKKRADKVRLLNQLFKKEKCVFSIEQILDN